MRAIQIAQGPGFTCEDNDTLLRAGLRAGLGFPYECNAGSCGTCKVELVSGAIDSLRPDAPGLGERDRAKHRVLACQARPTADCEIKVRLRDENVPRHRPALFRAMLAGTRDLTHDMREFRFTAEGAPGFLPGQYALFYMPGLDTPRTYSMSNVDDGSGEWHFIVRRMPGGTGTATLFGKVGIGEAITLDGPYGLAFLRTDSPRDIVCVAGGSGLAPILSIARGAVREPALAGRRIHVFYGARTLRDLAGEAEIAALPGYGERLTFQAVLSDTQADPPGVWSGPVGFVHDHVREWVGERWSDFEWYFAGPPLMAEAVQRMLIDKRVPFPQVHFDSFY
ncbi:MAG: 2Fe-2S iron-sulfur cluster-binding protein [Usitatibacter sp.]